MDFRIGTNLRKIENGPEKNNATSLTNTDFFFQDGSVILLPSSSDIIAANISHLKIVFRLHS